MTQNVKIGQRRKVEITSDKETKEFWDKIITEGKSVNDRGLVLNFITKQTRPLIPEVKKILYKRYWAFKRKIWWKKLLQFLGVIR